MRRSLEEILFLGKLGIFDEYSAHAGLLCRQRQVSCVCSAGDAAQVLLVQVDLPLPSWHLPPWVDQEGTVHLHTFTLSSGVRVADPTHHHGRTAGVMVTVPPPHQAVHLSPPLRHLL